MSEPGSIVPVSQAQDGSHGFLDWIAGAAVGALLALLVGMTITPVVSIVVTGLVALLAGLFSLSGSVAPPMPRNAIRRLTGFGIAAILVLPMALLMRSHDLFGRSLDSQRRELAELGITGENEQSKLLLFLRFGLIPHGYTVSEKAIQSTGVTVLYSVNNRTLCDELRSLDLEAPVSERLRIFETGGNEGKLMKKIVQGLPKHDQLAASKALTEFTCHPRAENEN